jgi:hypothetical protein
LKTALNLDQFRAAFHAGGFQSVAIRASGGHFFVTAEPRTGRRITLAATHGNKRRSFRSPARAIELLHRIGAHKVEVDTSEWDPGLAAAESRKRPDTAERQRRAHQAAIHDAWFRQQVEQALKEAGDAATVWDAQAEVKRQSGSKRAEWLAGRAVRKKAAR